MRDQGTRVANAIVHRHGTKLLKRFREVLKEENDPTKIQRLYELLKVAKLLQLPARYKAEMKQLLSPLENENG